MILIFLIKYLLIPDPLHFGHPKWHLNYPSCGNILSNFQELDPVFFPILSRFSLDTPQNMFTCIFNNPEDWERLQNQKYNYPIIPFGRIGRRKWVWAILSRSEESSQSCVPTHILSTELKELIHKNILHIYEIWIRRGLLVLEYEQPTVNTPFKSKNHGGFTWWGFFTVIHKFVSLYE